MSQEGNGRAAEPDHITAGVRTNASALTLLQDAIDALEEGFALFDADMRFLLCNDLYLDLACSPDVAPPQVDEPAEDIARRNFASGAFILPDNANIDQITGFTLEAVRACTREMEFWRSDGRVILTSANKTRQGGFLITVLDVTQRREAELAEREANDLLTTVIEACPANFLMSRCDDGEVLYRSPASKELFGEKPSARGHWQNPADRKEYITALKKHGRVDDMFVNGQRADGTTFPSQVSSRLIQYQGEDVIVSTTTDLTEALALKDESSRANARLRSAVEALDEGLVLYDQDKRLVLANSRYADMFGPHRDLLVPGTLMSEIIDKAVASGHISIVRGPEGGNESISRILEEQGSCKVEIKIADGTQRVITLGSLVDGGIVATVLDITDQRTTEVRARAMLSDAIEAVDFGIALVDDDERLVFANRKFRDIGDPNDELFVPGRLMRDIQSDAIEKGLFPLPPRTSPNDLLDGLDQMIRNGAKGFQVPNNRGSEIVGSIYETALQGRLLTLEDVTGQRRAERLFTDAVARLPVGVAIEGSNGQFTHCNDAFAAPFHMSPEALLSLAGEERIAVLAPQIATVRGKPVGDNAEAAFGNAIAHQRMSLAPFEVSFNDGRHYLVERAVTQDNGRVVVVTDTTALKEAEKHSLEVLNDAIQSLDESLVLFDPDLNLVMGNRRWYKMFFSHLPPPDIGENVQHMIDRLLAGNVMLAPEEMAQRSYTDQLIGLMRSYAKKVTLNLGDGTIWLASAHKTGLDGYLLSFTDITEQRRAEVEQREADMLLRKIVEACPANFLVSRVEDGKIIYCPPASRERFGNIESTLSFFLTPDDRNKYLKALLPTGSLDDYRVQFKRADGSVMQGLTAARVTDYKGEDVIVSSTRDISDQLAMQEELQRQREIAHQNEKLSALGELLAGVAHELNNPLSIVVGYAQMLEGRFEDPVLRKRVARIGQAAERSAKIVKTFLAMARQRPARIETCSLNEVVAMALDVAGYGLRSLGTSIVLELDEDLPHIAGDADQLAQVFTNLIVNAEHALTDRKQDGELVLRSYHDARTDHCVVEVRDNGAGIPGDIQTRIFEPFYTTKEVGTGTGIGLAFSHRIIDTHGGHLTVSSKAGKGTSFYVRLRATSDVSDPGEALPGSSAHTRRHKILVVDDEEGVAELIRDLLEDQGHQVTVASNAQHAITALEGQFFNAILSDFKMPGLDGEGFFQFLEENMPRYRTRIGFVTGDTMGTRVARFLKRTQRPYVEKPIAADELNELVDTLCSQPAGEAG